MKKRVLLWGLGSFFIKNYNLINYYEEKGYIEVIGVTAKTLKNTWLGEYRFIPYKRIREEKYDLIIVMSQDYFIDIINDGVSMGLDKELFIPVRVLSIPFFSFDKYLELKKSNISIIAQNCWGGLTYNYLGLEYLSPFINLSVSPEDMLKIMNDFDHYINYELKFKSMKYNKDLPGYHPVASLDDVEIRFIHYSTYEEARELWDKRKRRINYKNLLFMSNTDNMNYADEFLSSQGNNKILFTTFKSELKNTVYIENDNNKSCAEVVNAAASGRCYVYNPIDLLLESTK